MRRHQSEFIIQTLGNMDGRGGGGGGGGGGVERGLRGLNVPCMLTHSYMKQHWRSTNVGLTHAHPIVVY